MFFKLMIMNNLEIIDNITHVIICSAVLRNVLLICVFTDRWYIITNGSYISDVGFSFTWSNIYGHRRCILLQACSLLCSIYKVGIKIFDR